jgi:hypothetical protein
MLKKKKTIWPPIEERTWQSRNFRGTIWPLVETPSPLTRQNSFKKFKPERKRERKFFQLRPMRAHTASIPLSLCRSENLLVDSLRPPPLLYCLPPQQIPSQTQLSASPLLSLHFFSKRSIFPSKTLPFALRDSFSLSLSLPLFPSSRY